jgi:hypothetical protein
MTYYLPIVLCNDVNQIINEYLHSYVLCTKCQTKTMKLFQNTSLGRAYRDALIITAFENLYKHWRINCCLVLAYVQHTRSGLLVVQDEKKPCIRFYLEEKEEEPKTKNISICLIRKNLPIIIATYHTL